MLVVFFFFFQAEDGIRDAQESRGLGDVYKRQPIKIPAAGKSFSITSIPFSSRPRKKASGSNAVKRLSLIHI